MSAQFAIVRVSKIKEAGALAGHSGHVLRTIPTPNANTDHPRGVVRLFGDADPKTTVESAIATLGRPPRKGAVLALEVLLTASPGWLREGLPPGQYHPERVKILAEAAQKWTAKTFPDCPAVAHLHLDESTPHIHLTVVPIDRTPSAKGTKKEARLNAARWVDGSEKLKAIQDAWAETLAPYGLVRGQPSDRRHKTIQALYKELETDRAVAAKVLKTSKETAAKVLQTAEDEARDRQAAVEAAAARYIARTKQEAAAMIARACEEAQADREAAAADRAAAAADRQAAAAERRAAEAERAEARRLRDYLSDLVNQASTLKTYLTDAGRLAAARLKAQIDRAPGVRKRDDQR